MIEDLCFHLVDVTANAVTAGARRVRVDLQVSRQRDRVILVVEDDGRGMDAETARRVQDPFYTTKSGKRVGLGIPLMKQSALHCDGEFELTSRKGRGTRIRAEYRLSHVDTPPLGPLAATVLQLIAATPEVTLEFHCVTDHGNFSLSTREIRDQIGDMPLSHPGVLGFLRRYLSENLAGLFPRSLAGAVL